MKNIDIAKEIMKTHFKKIALSKGDLSFIDTYCEMRGIPGGLGHKIEFAIFLNQYKHWGKKNG